VYTGGTDQGQTSYLPLVRSDLQYDTIIHLSNGAGAPTSAVVTFYDSAGNVASVITSNLNGFALGDIDVAQRLGSGFTGSAVVSTNGSVVSTANLYTSSATYSDNMDTYSGVVSPSTQFALWTAKGFFAYSSVIDLQNTSGALATVTLEFLTTGTPVTTSLTVAAHGTTRFDVGQFAGLPANSVGVVVVQSNQPLVGVTEINGNGQFALAPPYTTWSNSTVYVPRFDANARAGWNARVEA